MFADLFSSLGCDADARLAVEDGEAVFGSLPRAVVPDSRQARNGAKATTVDRPLLRERVRYVLAYSLVFHYRRLELDEARRKLTACVDLLQRGGLATADFPCHGTNGDALVYLGQVQRRLDLHSDAARSYQAAIEHYSRRVEEKSRERAVPERHRRTSARTAAKDRSKQWDFSRWRIARCFLGLARVDYKLGHLRRALHNVQAARTLLLGFGDLHRAKVEILYGSIVRDVADSRRGDQLRVALDVLATAKTVFEQYYHGRSSAMAAYELAIAELMSGNPVEAEELVVATIARGVALQDQRLVCNCQIVRSWIARDAGLHKAALGYANKALEIATEHELSHLTRVDALIARGRIQLAIGELVSARKDVTEALALVELHQRDRLAHERNPQLACTCHLLLALCYAGDGRKSEASASLERGRAELGTVEDAGVLELAQQAEAAVEALTGQGDFALDVERHGLDFETHVEALRRHLYQRARQQSGNKVALAERLNVSRTTVDKWEKKYGRRRTT